MRASHRALRRVVLAAAAFAILADPALAQGDDASRGVRIIEGAPGQTPAAPSDQGPPALLQPTSPQPAAPQSSPAPDGGSLVAPAPPPPVVNLDIRQIAIRAENDAGLALSILPDVELAVGTKVELRVATKRQGYLILVDVDPTGKLTQIYPNRHMLERRDNQESLNLIKAGQAVTIPNRNNPYAGFEFVAAAPAGVAMLVAILSDRPVHLMDLPDVAPPGNGQAAFDQLFEVARRLRIAREDGSIASEGPHWSFDAKLYLVK
jgi:hypothetical protein